MASSLRRGAKLQETIELVYETITQASHSKLECEAIATALIFLKQNPNATIEEALQVGLNDWDL